MDEDEVPAKRLKTATIVTRSSRARASEESTVDANIHHTSPPTSNRSPGPGSNTEPETPNTDTIAPTPGAHTNPTKDATTIDAAPTPRRSHTVSMDVDVSGVASETGDTTGVGVRRARNIPATPPQLPSPPPVPGRGSKLKIPDFLVGKKNIYHYFSSLDDTGFRNLLNGYIIFESANRSNIRGSFTTAYRPRAIEWWSSRARPDKIPPFDSLKSYADSVVEWWIFIQPDWRGIQLGVISRVEGDWERLYQPGVNGLLNVVALAHWWARIFKERKIDVDETYSWFVSDVTWVLSQLTGVARAGIY